MVTKVAPVCLFTDNCLHIIYCARAGKGLNVIL